MRLFEFGLVFRTLGGHDDREVLRTNYSAASSHHGKCQYDTVHHSTQVRIESHPPFTFPEDDLGWRINIHLTPFSSEDFTDLSESWIKLKVKITTTGTAGDDRGKQIACGAQTETNSYALVNQPISSLFQSVNIRLNDSLLSDNYGNYPYLSYLTSIFNYSSDVRNTRLRLAGFCTDLDPDANTAHGAAPASSFKTRAGWTTAAAQPTFIGPIFHGLFHQAM